jgi:putative heme iron utilization protein
MRELAKMRDAKKARYEELIREVEAEEAKLEAQSAEEPTTLEGQVDRFMAEVKARMIKYYGDLKAMTPKERREVASKADCGICDWGWADMVEIIEKDVQKRKRAFIMKVEKKLVGEVKGSYLHLGMDGEFNGHIEADNIVTVSTIIAGGYNIQKIHYRVLVK